MSQAKHGSMGQIKDTDWLSNIPAEEVNQLLASPDRVSATLERAEGGKVVMGSSLD